MKNDRLIPNKYAAFDSDSDGSSIHGGGGELDLPSNEENDGNEIALESDNDEDEPYMPDINESDDTESEEESDTEDKMNGSPSTSCSMMKENDKEDRNDDDDSDDAESTTSEEVEASMGDIFGVTPNVETTRNHPPNFKTESPVFDLCFHPETELLASGTIDGDCVVYRYNKEKVEEVCKFSHHTKSCRQICYNGDGTKLYTVSKDRSMAVIDTNNATVIKHIKDIHDSPIYSFCDVDDNIVVTGDDDGVVKIWDLRGSDPIFEYKCGEQTITSLLTDDVSRYLSATVADGSLTGINLRMKRMEAQSEMNDGEYACQALIRADTRLAIGTASGAIQIFNWGSFGAAVDGIKGHPDLVQCMATLTDNILITGCEDGNIRALHLYGHKFLGIVGQHKDFGVENIAISHDGNLLASCSMDEEIQFWDIEYLYKKTVHKRKRSNKKADAERHLVSSKRRNRSEFFRDLPTNVDSDDENGPVPGPSYVDSD